MASVLRVQVPHRRDTPAGCCTAWVAVEYPGVVGVDARTVVAGVGGGEWVSHMACLYTGLGRRTQRLQPRMRNHSLRMSSPTWSSSYPPSGTAWPRWEQHRLRSDRMRDGPWARGEDMPGFDGTGPRGQGHLSGRGMGYCVVEVSKLASSPGPSVAPAVPYRALIAHPRPVVRYWLRGACRSRFGRRRGRRGRW